MQREITTSVAGVDAVVTFEINSSFDVSGFSVQFFDPVPTEVFMASPALHGIMRDFMRPQNNVSEPNIEKDRKKEILIIFQAIKSHPDNIEEAYKKYQGAGGRKMFKPFSIWAKKAQALTANGEDARVEEMEGLLKEKKCCGGGKIR